MGGWTPTIAGGKIKLVNEEGERELAMELTRISVPMTVAEREAFVKLAQHEAIHPQELARQVLYRFIRRNERIARKNKSADQPYEVVGAIVTS